MTISFFTFFDQMISNPVLAITVLLTLAVILVNGWTDAPNAIATCVSTRAIGVRKAIVMAAVFNFFGVFVMTMINASVAATIYNMVGFWRGCYGSVDSTVRRTVCYRHLGDCCLVVRVSPPVRAMLSSQVYQERLSLFTADWTGSTVRNG